MKSILAPVMVTLCFGIAAAMLAAPARADVISDLIRKKQVERFATQERFYDPVPVIVPNNFRIDAQRSDTIAGSEVMECHRQARADRRAEFTDLYLPDAYNSQAVGDSETACLARKRLRLLHR